MIKKSQKPFMPLEEQWMRYRPERGMLDDINEMVDWRKINSQLEKMIP